MDARRVVMVFARAPRLGAVKTRLAAGVGEQEALRVHRVLLEHALDIAAGVPAAAGELWIAGDDVGGECARLAARRGLRLEHQCEGDLGARMHAAVCAYFRLFGPDFTLPTAPPLTRGGKPVCWVSRRPLTG